MCLIIVKPRGVKMPSKKLLKQAWSNNHDGFGLAYALPGAKPHIRKGAMTLKGVLNLVRTVPRPLEAEIIMHFRLATKGYIWEGNCHPFPLSKDYDHLTALDITSPMAIAHNGIIWSSLSSYKGYDSCKGYNYLGESYQPWGEELAEDDLEHDALSDTQEFIKDYLVDMGDAIFNRGVQKYIADETDSKFAILTHKGFILIGEFDHDEDTGLYFSNLSYKTANYYAPAKGITPKSVSTLSVTEGQTWKYKCGLCNAPIGTLFYYDKMWLCRTCYDILREEKEKVMALTTGNQNEKEELKSGQAVPTMRVPMQTNIGGSSMPKVCAKEEKGEEEGTQIGVGEEKD